MSRKKAAKGKAATSSPSAGSPTGKGIGKAARSSPGIVQMNGVVHPSRPSVSNSSEFYDIAFKVRSVHVQTATRVKKWSWFDHVTPTNTKGEGSC